MLITITQVLFFGVPAVLAVFVADTTDSIKLPINFRLGCAANRSYFRTVWPRPSFIFFRLCLRGLCGQFLQTPRTQSCGFITYFPVTAPTTSLIRNTLGNISVGEAAISLAIMGIVAFLVLWLVIKVFPKGALEFQNPLSLRAM